MFALKSMSVQGPAVPEYSCCNVPLVGEAAIVHTRPSSGSGLVLIGSSVGGTQAVEAILRALPADGPGIAIVQHLPEKFAAAVYLILPLDRIAAAILEHQSHAQMRA